MHTARTTVIGIMTTFSAALIIIGFLGSFVFQILFLSFVPEPGLNTIIVFHFIFWFFLTVYVFAAASSSVEVSDFKESGLGQVIIITATLFFVSYINSRFTLIALPWTHAYFFGNGEERDYEVVEVIAGDAKFCIRIDIKDVHGERVCSQTVFPNQVIEKGDQITLTGRSSALGFAALEGTRTSAE